jgi:hypothetical protein
MLVSHARDEKTPFSRMPTLTKEIMKESSTMIMSKKSMKGSIEFLHNESLTNREKDFARRRESEGQKDIRKKV